MPAPAPPPPFSPKPRWADLHEEEAAQPGGSAEEEKEEDEEEEEKDEDKEGACAAFACSTNQITFIIADGAVMCPDSKQSALKPLVAELAPHIYGKGYELYAVKCKGAAKLDEHLASHPPMMPCWRKSKDVRGLRTDTDGPARTMAKITSMTLASLFCRGPTIPGYGSFEAEETLPPKRQRVVAPGPVFRFCAVEQLARLRARKTGEMPTGESRQLSVSTWNSGSWRGAMRSMDFFRCGSFHVIIGQEIAEKKQKTSDKKPWDTSSCSSSGDDAVDLQMAQIEEAGFVACVSNWNMVGIRRGDGDVSLVADFKDDTDLAGIIAKVRFLHGHAGIKELFVASIHLNNKRAKKKQVSYDACVRFLRRCIDNNVDIIGVDINQAYDQLMSALRDLGGGVVIKPPGNTDCVMMLAPSSSRLVSGPSQMAGRAKFYNLHPGDLSWAPRDADSHWLITCHMRQVAGRGLRQRSAEAAVQYRKRKDAARKARKAVAKAAAKAAPLP